MISDSDEVRLVDFGLSWQGKSECTKRRGTVYYMAPEVIQLRPSFHSKVDIWSLGVLLFRLVSGHFPFNDHDD